MAGEALSSIERIKSLRYSVFSARPRVASTAWLNVTAYGLLAFAGSLSSSFGGPFLPYHLTATNASTMHASQNRTSTPSNTRRTTTQGWSSRRRLRTLSAAPQSAHISASCAFESAVNQSFTLPFRSCCNPVAMRGAREKRCRDRRAGPAGRTFGFWARRGAGRLCLGAARGVRWAQSGPWRRGVCRQGGGASFFPRK